MALDPRTPVLVGVGQWSNRVDRGEPAAEPADMMAEALRRAAADSGATGDVLVGADAVRVVSILSRRYRNAARLVAERLAQREQLVLEAFLALFGPPARAVERWGLLRSLYPDYFPAHYNLALFAWDLTNDYAIGLRDGPAGLDRKNPAFGPLHYLLATLLVGEERFDGGQDTLVER